MAGSLASRVYQRLSNCLYLPSYLVSHFMNYCYRAFATLKTHDKRASLPAPVYGNNSKCRYRLNNDTSATLALPDGRKLGYAQYGSPTGRAILYLHGLPGSRVEAVQFDELAVRLGGRIIAADRPGIGWSSPQPNRTVLDHAKDIEHLAQHLELDVYGVLGISAGGPYALACAASLPSDKLKGVTIVCGLGPPDIGTSGMNWLNWLGFTIGHPYFPGIVRWWISRDPIARLDLPDEERLELIQRQFLGSKPHEKDVEVFKNEDLLRLILRSSREHFAQGTDAFSQDGTLMCTDLGFALENISPDLPFQLWYGKLDTNVPLIHGEQIALRLGGRAHLRVEDETHSSLVVNWKEKFMEDLIKII